ncbi:MAG: NAD-dependent epimerase/dehydratase family protein [Burkholderiaceae bacterium]|nr:NAD-dependent epimerase/dehydratase family protein [Burkholderiaceae bacterium]
MKNVSKKVLILGASGIVGYAAMKHFRTVEGCEVVGVARRPPADTFGAKTVALDLTDSEACAAVIDSHPDVTHVLYAAVQESSDVSSGWRSTEQIDLNDRMFRNILGPLVERSRTLQHVALLQGGKAYGSHVRKVPPIPVREGKDEWRTQDNFYWRHEDYLRQSQMGRSWRWTILRPPAIFGEAIGSALSKIGPIGVYGAILKEKGLPLSFPGGERRIRQTMDADLLARCIAWAGVSPNAHNEVFNVSNGDVYTWQDLWPTVASAMAMEVGEPSPHSLAAELPKRSAEWDVIRQKYGLVAPPLMEFVGSSLTYLDWTWSYNVPNPPSSIMSCVKIMKAGFTEVMDTEDMMRDLFKRYQDKRLLPPVG